MPQKILQPIKKQCRKHSDRSFGSSDFSSDCEQTYLEDSQQFKKQFALHDVQFQDPQTIYSLQNPRSDVEKSNQDFKRSYQQQIRWNPKNVFLSISKDYNENIKQKFTQKSELFALKNLSIKTLKKNMKIRQWKFQFFKKLYFLIQYSPKNSQEATKKQFLKKLDRIINLQTKKLQEQQKQIKFFMCHQCKSYYFSKTSILKHIKNTKHHQVLMIQSLNCRRILKKHYVTFQIVQIHYSKQLNIKFFDPELLYTHFQVIFLDAEMHYLLFGNSKMQNFVSSLLNLKDLDIIFIDSNDQEVERWFKTQWMQIYLTLHQFHKGNQFLCHKCLSIPQHICLFALGLNFLLNKKRKKLLSTSINQKNFPSILKLVQLVLRYYLEKPTKKQVKIKTTDFKALSVFLDNVRDLLFNYFKAFDYINLAQCQVKNELEDYLF